MLWIRYLIDLFHVFDEFGLLALLQMAVLDYLFGKLPQLIEDGSLTEEGVRLQPF